MKGNLSILSVDSSGNVYIADSGNYRIQVFTALGEFFVQFGYCKGEKDK